MQDAMHVYSYVSTTLGDLLVVKDAVGLCQLTFPEHRHPRPVQPDWQRDDDAFADVHTQVDAYLAGTRRDFSIPLSLQGTPFQTRVWQALLRVPYGETITYAQLARAIGRPEAFHAVGAAVGMNPISIIVPCHRALGSDGGLTGYAGGIERKIRLLKLEGSLLI